jgi:hypothetical protein
LIYLIKEDYNNASKSSKSANESNKGYYKGQQLAYYSVLSLIEHHLRAFDEENQFIGKILPEPGKQAKF